jgi:hypothetical protein
LRAFPLAVRTLGFGFARVEAKETSAVLRFDKFKLLDRAAQAVGSTCLGLVNDVVTEPNQNLKLESLILAQSERWRQA